MPLKPRSSVKQVLVDHYYACDSEGPCFRRHRTPTQTSRSFLEERAAQVADVLRQAGHDTTLPASHGALIVDSRDQLHAALRAQLRWRKRAQAAGNELDDLRDRVWRLAEEWYGIPEIPYARLAGDDVRALLKQGGDK